MNSRLKARLRWLSFVALVAVGAPAAMMIAAAGLAFLLRREPLWQAWLHPPQWSSLGYGLLGGLTSMTLVLALHTLSPAFARGLTGSSLRTAEEAVSRFGWQAMLLIGTLAALGEESLFRGALQPTLGITLAALLFGFSHGGWRPGMWAYAVAAALAGAVFGNIYLYTGDLWAAILAHAVHNVTSIVFVTLGLLPGGDEEAEAEPAAGPATVEVMPVSRPTPRELGVVVGSLPPGPQNAITDVPGVCVGHCTVWAEAGTLAPGRGPWRTGVTAVLPHGGNLCREKVPAAAFVLNGFLKATGLVQVAELGVLETPILLTGTLSTFRVADALVGWMLEQNSDLATVNPVVLECNDSWLSDARSRPIGEEHVRAALAAASGGPVAQGAVGAGAGMRAFGYKAGIGTASRRVGGFTLGVLVLANFGRREELIVLGEPVGPALREPAAEAGPAAEATAEPADRAPAEPAAQAPAAPAGDPPAEAAPGRPEEEPAGSCCIVLATDAPLDARQLQRLARRATLGIVCTGGIARHGSGDLCLAFSTAYRLSDRGVPPAVALLPDAGPALDPLFAAAVEATEEAILSALFCAPAATGRDGRSLPALPVETVLEHLRRAGRI